MSNFKKILAMLLCFILALSCVGCGENYEDAIVYFELLEKPQTLDPQTAQSDSELLIVRNIYEGLLRESSSGEIVNGICDNYTYNNFTYTFNLRDDAFWSNGEPVTAFDFEYAFKRAVNPQIKAPFVSRLFAIENAELIASGGADISTLGVKAVNDITFTITLCREDAHFLKTLTTSVCMPCKETFFENSIGKYGLDSEYIISNGSYRLTKWNKEDFGIRIYRNEEYSGEFKAQNEAVFISCIDDEPQLSRLSGGESDITFVNGYELATLENNQIVTESVENICWLLKISNEFSSEVRQAFAMSFDANVYNDALSNGFSTAKSIYPDILSINTEGIGITPYNINEAKTLMSAQIKGMEDKKFPSATLYYYNENGAKELATAIVAHWQQNLSTFINIQPSDNLTAIQKEIVDNTLQFALFPVRAKSGSFDEYSKNFVALSEATTPDILQQELLSAQTLIPVAYQNTNISYIAALENVAVFDDNGYIDFSQIIKK